MYGDQRNYPFQVQTATVPRCYYYPTSDGSDSGSPGGGGGGGANTGSGDSYGTQRTAQQQSQNRGYDYVPPQEDTPYNPSRSAGPQIPSSSTRGFVLPPEHHLSGAMPGATPPFSGDAQYGGPSGQYQQYYGGTQYSQSQPTVASYGQTHSGLVLPAPQRGDSSHRQQHYVGSSTPPSSQSSTHSGLNSPTAAPTMLQIQEAPSSQFPDAGDYLRHQLGLSPGAPVNLNCLPDPPPGCKPSQPYPILIKLALYGSPQKKLTLKGIYGALEDRFEYFRIDRTRAWQRSIRHNLSLNQVFRNTPRPISEPGKGSYWELDVSQGEGYKRERKRRKKGAAPRQGQKSSDSRSSSDDGDDESEISPPSRCGSPTVRTEPGNVGPVRTAHMSPFNRRSSPYTASEGPSIRAVGSSRTYTTGTSRTGSPSWGNDPHGAGHAGAPGQVPQAGYYQPQPQPHGAGTLPPLVMPSQENHQQMFRSGPFAHTMAWHAQQHMRQQQMSSATGVASPFSYAPSPASPFSGSHGQLGYPPASQVLPGGMHSGTVQYQGFGQPGPGQPYEEPEAQSTTHGNKSSQGGQGGKGKHGG